MKAIRTLPKQRRIRPSRRFWMIPPCRALFCGSFPQMKKPPQLRRERSAVRVRRTSLCYNSLTMPARFLRTALLIFCAAIPAATLVQASLFAQSAPAPGAAAGASNPGTLLVFPFENDSRVASLDWLGEGIAELTAERLQDRGMSLLSRQDRLAALEKIGLPDSARFSHATIVKIAT